MSLGLAGLLTSCAATPDTQPAATPTAQTEPDRTERGQQPHAAPDRPEDRPADDERLAAQGDLAADPPAPKPPKPDPPQSEPPAPPQPQTKRINLPEGIVVQRNPPAVEFPAWVCLDEGWLEQVACSPGTREHESLVVVRATPSAIHAAMLLAGFEHGRPGFWTYDWETETFHFQQPTGDEVEVYARYRNAEGDLIEEPMRQWIAGPAANGEREPFPDKPFIFAGSKFVENPPFMEEGHHYEADMSGSIIGIVTFGDEVIGFSDVIADQVAVHPAAWEIDIDRIPPMNTEVTVIIRPFARDGDDTPSPPPPQPGEQRD